MRRRSHIRLYLIATFVWAGFLVGGLPTYYQQYSTATMAIFDLRARPPEPESIHYGRIVG